jgi:hypothetical protein
VLVRACRSDTPESTCLDPLGIEGLTLLDVLGSAQSLGASVAGKTLVVRQAGKGRRQSSQESDESEGVHLVQGCERFDLRTSE